MYAWTYLYPQVMRNAAAALKEVIDQMRSSVVLTSANGHQREDAALVLHKSCIAEANKVRCSDDDPILIIVTKMLLHTLCYTQMITRAEALPTQHVISCRHTRICAWSACTTQAFKPNWSLRILARVRLKKRSKHKRNAVGARKAQFDRR